jgi:rhodanese-related sulfurtransferase
METVDKELPKISQLMPHSCHSRKQSAPGILPETGKDAGQAEITEWLNVRRCILLVFSFFVLLPGSSHCSEWQWIEPERVYEMMREGSGMWLIDVRSSLSYETAHIEGSVNIPALSLPYRKFPAGRTLILIDDSLGQRIATESAEKMSKYGLERVYVLAGGIVSWELEGYPVVMENPVVRTVSRDELKWALANRIPLQVFDMRDASDIKTGSIEGSLSFSGKGMPERLEKIRELLKEEEQSGMDGRLKKRRTVVLVFPETDDAEAITQKTVRGIKTDVRYLIGGYKTFAMEKYKGWNTTGSCPTCRGNEQ